jgi:hypothetical protein
MPARRRLLALAAAVMLAACNKAAPVGKVTMVDEQGTRVIEATELPEAMRFVEVDGGRVPVAKIEMRRAGDRGEIFKYGPNGELLEVTVGHFGE